MEHLLSFSHRCGADPDLVLAGGGNTSLKENGVLTVKSSGCSLADIRADQFVRMDLEALRAIVNKTYPHDDKSREALFLADVNAARLPGETRRPSVEALLHALFSQRYVLHLHPALVNGLTCGRFGARAAAKLFPEALWVPACRPGYTLARLLADRLTPEVTTVLLQNHGVFFAAETEDGLYALLDRMLQILAAHVGRPLPSENALPPADLSRPFTPDHIVYCGLGPSLPDTENARLLYRDACKILFYCQSFGGPHPLRRDLIRFITNWEAESYRKKQG